MLAHPAFLRLLVLGEPCGLGHPFPAPVSIPAHTAQRFPARS